MVCINTEIERLILKTTVAGITSVARSFSVVVVDMTNQKFRQFSQAVYHYI